MKDSIKILLEDGDVVKINGIPVEIDGAAVIRVMPSNVPLMYCCQPPCANEYVAEGCEKFN
jgi:hypothetical protein